MKKIKKINKPNLQIVVDPALDRFSGVVLFKEKVEAAKKLLLHSPIPQEFYSA